MGLLSWITKRWQGLWARRADKASLKAGEFTRLAAEVAELARLAARVCPGEEAFLDRLGAMEKEMEELTRMALSPRFRLVSPERRRFLRKSLLRSRDQLMASVSEIPAPTRLPQ